MSAARAAGRGAALRAPPRAPEAPAAPAGRGRGGERGRLSAAVLSSGREGRGRRGARREPAPYERDFAPGASEQRRGKRKGQEDWFSSGARKRALEAARNADVHMEVAKLPTPPPFAWGDFWAVLEEMPDGHWAADYVECVAQTLEGNAAIRATDKQRILNDTLRQLSLLSERRAATNGDVSDDERFADAPDDARSVAHA